MSSITIQTNGADIHVGPSIEDGLLGLLVFGIIGGILFAVGYFIYALWRTIAGKLLILCAVIAMYFSWQAGEREADALPPGFPAQVEVGMVYTLSTGLQGHVIKVTPGVMMLAHSWVTVRQGEVAIAWDNGNTYAESLRQMKGAVRELGATLR